MAYVEHTWVNGETITAEKMNNIEEGIVEASQSGGSSYDAVILAYQDDASYWSGYWELTVQEGSWAAVAAKLDEGTEPPNVLVKIKSLAYSITACVPGIIIYYNPDASVPFFEVHANAILGPSVHDHISTPNPFYYHLVIDWESNGNIFVVD